jgi:acid stress chaperone HdeA
VELSPLTRAVGRWALTANTGKEITMALPRIVIGVVTAALLAGTTLALAQSSGTKKPLGTMTCEDFLGIDDSIKPKMVYWAVAYGKGGKPESAVLDIEATEKVIPVLIDECQKAPKASFWQKMKAEFKKLEKTI